MNDEPSSARVESVPDEGPRRRRPDDQFSDAEVYRFLTTYYLYQDQLSWSRTQTLVAIEAALLGGAFALKGLIASFALLLGSLLVWLIWRLVQRDWEIRDQNLDILDLFHEKRAIKMVKPAKGPFWRGSVLLPLIVWLLISTNSVLAMAFAYCSLSNAAEASCCGAFASRSGHSRER